MESSTQKATRRLRRQNRQNLGLKLCRLLYKGIDGFLISTAYRKSISGDDTSYIRALTYGEIEPKSFLQILQWIENNDASFSSECLGDFTDPSVQKRLFVDLGCGVGRACICAAFSVGCMFTHVKGIDIIPGLIDQAHIVHTQLVQLMGLLEHGPIATAAKKSDDKKVVKSEDVNEESIFQSALQIMHKRNSSIMLASDLANAVCHQLGHKKFNIIVKKHKTFINLINSQKDLFTVSSDMKQIELHPTVSTTSDHHNFTDSSLEMASPAEEELVSSDIYESSTEMKRKAVLLNEMIAIFEGKDTYKSLFPVPHVEYETNDIFQTSWWQDCKVCYAASLLFSDDMMENLTKQVLFMNTGSWFITLKPLILNTAERHEKILLRHESFFDMSWEMAKVFIYQITV